MAMTEIGMKALRPGAAVYTVADDRGLYAEVFPTGGIVWRFRYRLNGKLEKLTLGKYPALSLKNARLARDEAAAMVALGASPAQQKQLKKVAQADDTTLAEFAVRFMDDVQSKQRKNPKMPKRYLDKDILPFIGQKKLREVSIEDIRSVIWRKKDHGFDSAAGQVRGVLKRLMDYALARGLIDANPVLALPMRHIHKAGSRDRTLSSEELRIFLTAVLQSNMRRQFKVALRLLLMTMVRKSELLLARWEDIDFEAAEWSIPKQHSKTGKPHIVYLSRQAITLFRELEFLACGSELVLPGRGSLTKPFAHNCINTALKKAMQGEDIPAFTIHDLRRTASTLLHENGWPSDVVEKALNHTAGGVRGIYNRAQYARQRREMLQFWSDYIDSRIENQNVIFASFRHRPD